MSVTAPAPRDLGGRPVVGPPVNVRIPPDTLARIDAAADAQGLRRAEWIRRAVDAALS